MARPQSTADLNHVPTPEAVIDSLRAICNIPPGVHALDPCCGDGSMLHRLNPSGINYGVELDADRAGIASTRLHHVLPCAIQDTEISYDSFGLCFMNPPYDSSTEGRLESVFVERCARKLARDGILILVIKHTMYREVASKLMRWFDVLGHWRFPDPYFNGPTLAFEQTVLIARRRVLPVFQPDYGAFLRSLHLDALDPLPRWVAEPLPVYTGHEPMTFLSATMSPENLATILASSPLSRTMPMPPVLRTGRPPLPLKQGHIALVLASGLINGVYGDGPSKHVAKGSVLRKTRKEVTTEVGDDGETRIIEKITHYFAVQINALTPDGTIHSMATSVAAPAEATT